MKGKLGMSIKSRISSLILLFISFIVLMIYEFTKLENSGNFFGYNSHAIQVILAAIIFINGVLIYKDYRKNKGHLFWFIIAIASVIYSIFFLLFSLTAKSSFFF